MIKSEEIRNLFCRTECNFDGCPEEMEKLHNYITQQEELTTTVKRYFELKAKGITNEAEALEHRELLSKLYEMVGIEE